MKSTIIIFILALISLASCEWLIQAFCPSAPITVSYENGNCVKRITEAFPEYKYLKISCDAGTATMYNCKDEKCSDWACKVYKKYPLHNSCYQCLPNAPDLSQYFNGSGYSSHYFWDESYCKPIPAYGAAVETNKCDRGMAVSCKNNVETRYLFSDANCARMESASDVMLGQCIADQFQSTEGKCHSAK